MKLFRPLFLPVFFFFFTIHTHHAQCPNDNRIFHEVDLTPAGEGDTKTHLCMWGGDHARFTVATGNEYRIRSCDGPFNTYLTIYAESGGALLGSSNVDNCTTDDEDWYWTAPIDGNVFILVDDENCAHEPGCVFTSVTLLSVFPVDLVDFKAQPSHDKTIVLDWETAREQNNDFFEILRSTDGLSFETIAQVKGHGTTSETQFYQYKDRDVEANILYYYKLRQVDFDDQYKDSFIETAMFEDDQLLLAGRLSPNPAKDITYLDFKASSATVYLSIKNMNGQIIQTQVYDPSNLRFNQIPIDLTNIESTGVYFLFVEIGEERFTKKLFVSK